MPHWHRSFESSHISYMRTKSLLMTGYNLLATGKTPFTYKALVANNLLQALQGTNISSETNINFLSSSMSGYFPPKWVLQVPHLDRIIRILGAIADITSCNHIDACTDTYIVGSHDDRLLTLFNSSECILEILHIM